MTKVVVRHALLSLVPVVLLGAVLATSYRNEAQRRGVEEGRAQALGGGHGDHPAPRRPAARSGPDARRGEQPADPGGQIDRPRCAPPARPGPRRTGRLRLGQFGRRRRERRRGSRRRPRRNASGDHPRQQRQQRHRPSGSGSGRGLRPASSGRATAPGRRARGLPAVRADPSRHRRGPDGPVPGSRLRARRAVRRPGADRDRP